MLADRQEKQAEEEEQAEQNKVEQGQLLDVHVGLPITAAIGEVVQELKRQPPPPLAASPTISAPSGLPRAVKFVGRAQMPTDLLAQLRTGGVVGVFALAGMGGVGETELAAEAVARLAAEPPTSPAGAAWIACEDLRGVESLDEVWTRVARALDASELAALSDAEQRRAALHGLLAVLIVVAALGWLTYLVWLGPRKTAALLNLTLTHLDEL